MASSGPQFTGQRWRAVRMTERRTRADSIVFVRWVVESWSPWADRAVLVTDNLNTHTHGSLYEAFRPRDAGG